MSSRGKGKAPLGHPSDLIALGSKSTPSSSSSSSELRDPGEGGASSLSGSGSSHHGSADLFLHHHPSKKPKLSSSGWEVLAINEIPEDLVGAVLEAEEERDLERAFGLLCGSVKALRHRKPNDQCLHLSLLYLAKNNPFLFSASEAVIEAFCSLLKRTPAAGNYKNKPLSSSKVLPVLAANILMAAFAQDRNWPEIFVRVFIEDAKEERNWVDHPDCKGFVDNILTAFNTKRSSLPPLHNAPGFNKATTPTTATPTDRDTCPSPVQGGSASGSGSATPTRVTDEDVPMEPMNVDNSGHNDMEIAVVPRYQGLTDVIEHIVIEIVRDHLNNVRRPNLQEGGAVSKNFLKFLTAAAGLVEVRLAVVSKLEAWINNMKIFRQAQELLLSVAVNCNTHSQIDIDVIGAFTKFRFKSKQNLNLFLSAIRELCSAHENNLPTLVKHTLFNELSNSRNVNNMNMLSVMFSVDGDRAAQSLAGVFIDLLLQKDDYLRALRLLLREIVKALKHDINLRHFVNSLLQCSINNSNTIKDFEFKDRMLKSISDLITMSIFLGISPRVREPLAIYLRGGVVNNPENNKKNDYTPLKNYLMLVAKIQFDAVSWLYDHVPKIYKPHQDSFIQCLHKILFMVNLVSAEEYLRIDGWPAENDRNLFFKATGEVPILQDTMVKIFEIGMAKNLPLNGLDTIHLVEDLIKRAASLVKLNENGNFPILYVDKPKEIIKFLFNLAAYNFPDTIPLPNDYIPPVLAISNAYWKVWMILVLLAAHNPNYFGELAWDNYPTLKAFMEMSITNQFTFPPPTFSDTDDLKNKELQIYGLEKHSILELENHLAKPNVISESNSILLPQLITMNPCGELRKPPDVVLDQLKKLNVAHKIGHLLCRSRKPDFLLDILQRQGSNEAMPWLADLVESSEGSFNVLPVQCLCEFLLNTDTDTAQKTAMEDEEVTNNRKRKQKQLLLHLQNLLQNPNSDPNQCFETLDYFLRRLSSNQTNARIQALKGLRLVLTPIGGGSADDHPDIWLLHHLPSLPCFGSFYIHIAQQLKNACWSENDPNTVSLYIQFLAQYAPLDNFDALSDLCLDMASIIVERSTLCPALLPGNLCKSKNPLETFKALLVLFTSYMIKAIQMGVNARPASAANANNGELIRLHWSSGRTAILYIFIVHAQVILLTYGPSSLPEFQTLLDIWHCPDFPKGFLIESPDEILMIPDWLKLRMIRSNIPCLVDSALRGLNPNQLVLFIQSFGISVDSMSKLLKALDLAVSQDSESVNEEVMDKTYMGQLVSVQHERGAIGGNIFASTLNLTVDKIKRDDDVEIIDDEFKKLPPPIIPPRSTAIIPPGQVKNTLLHLFDVGSPSRLTMKEKQDTFRTLQKFLSAEISPNNRAPMKPMLDAVVKALQTIIFKSEFKEGFINALLQRTSFSCSLFRMITLACLKNSSGTTSNTLLKVSKEILSFAPNSSSTSSPLISLLKNYVTKKGPESTPKVKQESSDELIINSDDKEFEKKTKKILSDGLSQGGGQINVLIESLSKMMLKPEYDTKTGLLTDWLEILDPEVINAAPELQGQLLFSSSVRCRPYLMTMLIHQSSWKTLRTTIHDVLLKKFNKDFDSVAVLDFLSACLYIPKLWRGRQKHVPKHETPPDVLGLTISELKVLMDYVIDEESKSKDGEATLNKRMSLIIRCLNTDEKASNVISYLIEDKNEDHKNLIFLIYMKIPKCLSDPSGILGQDFVKEESRTSWSALDSVSHTLLSALAATQAGRDWGSQMQEFESAARKMSSSHPLLMLRNLPLLTSSLKGRTQYDFSYFRSRNHLKLYNITLGLMDLLRPLIFKPQYRNSLHEALQCFFEMITVYEFRKDSFYGLIDKFAGFLLKYMNELPNIAIPFIRENGGNIIPNLNPNRPLINLTTLIDSISWVEGDINVVSINNNKKSLEIQKFLNRFQKLEDINEDLLGKSEDLMSLLSDLTAASTNKPEILTPFFNEEIKSALDHPVRNVRSQAFTLFLRILNYRPKISADMIPAYINCIESDDPSVVNTALEKLSQVCVLAQESIGNILQCVFSLGLYSNIDVNPFIGETVSLLNSHAGY